MSEVGALSVLGRPARPLEDLAEEICAGAARIAAATARWLALVAEFDRREGWAGVGVKSCAHWLGWRCGLAPNAAREHVRVARALTDLPAIAGAFATGRLSYSKVRAVTRVADADTEADLLEVALAGTAAHVEKIVRGWRRADDLAAEPEDTSRFGLSVHWDDDGSLRVSGRLCAEDGAMLLTALQAAAERVDSGQDCSDPVDSDRVYAERSDPGSVDCERSDSASTLRGQPGAEQGLQLADTPRLGGTEPDSPRRCSQGEALLEIARAFLDPDPARRSVAARHQVVVHVDADVLAADNAAGAAHLDGGPALSAEQVARIGCDASLVVLLQRGHEVLDIGRSTRAIPAPILRALWARDGGCRFPGCHEDRRSRVQGHHIRFWSRGGRTALGNLVLVCGFHHRQIHQAGFIVAMGPQGRPTFADPDGRRLDESPPAVANEQPLPAVAGELTPTWGGEPLDLDYAIHVLLSRRDYTRRRHRDTRRHGADREPAAA